MTSRYPLQLYECTTVDDHIETPMAFALPTEVPVIDLACTHCDLSTEVGAALRRFGFFYVRHHGVPDLLIAQQFEQSKRLFDLPAATKAGLTFNATLDIGYTGGSGVIQALDPNQTTTSAADTKEGFMHTNNAVMDGTPVRPEDPLHGATLRWPPGLPRYEKVIRKCACRPKSARAAFPSPSAPLDKKLGG